MDDTHLVTWGNTAADNCRKLETAHVKCLDWAKRHGACFGPHKYHLIHFTRRRRDPNNDLASSIRLATVPIQPEPSLTVLGLHISKDLSWRSHVAQAADKGLAAYTALARISASTWGPSFAAARLIYSTVVRPTMLHGAQIWGVKDNGEPAKPTLIQPLKALQNRCLRRVAGAYKRTPTAALERETDIPPIDLYIDKVATQHALSTRHHPVIQDIKRATDGVWASLTQRPAANTQTPSRRPRETPPVGLTPPAPEPEGAPTLEGSEASTRNLSNPSAPKPKGTGNEQASPRQQAPERSKTRDDPQTGTLPRM